MTPPAPKPLAIVIPAYKIDFFEQTLSSIAAQTCKDFTLYVGNDASTDAIGEACRRLGHLVDIRYTRFEQNLGARSLTAQWGRCIELTQGEPWIWLFSDDDEMEPRCVEHFLDKISQGEPTAPLYHFNVDIIDADGAVERRTSFPPLLHPRQFVAGRLRGRLNSYAVEYIFSREAFDRCGGFVDFDLAWNSDDATWLRLAPTHGITTLAADGAAVRWRRSCTNITGQQDDPAIVLRKLRASLQYLGWLRETFPDMMAPLRMKLGMVTWMMTSLAHSRQWLTPRQIGELTAHFHRVLRTPWLRLPSKLYYLKRCHD